MVEDPDPMLPRWVEAGCEFVIVHAEACRHLHRTLSSIRELGVRSGVALNPATPLSAVEYLLPQLDMMLIMSVNPGFGGQSFISFCMDKIRDLRAMIDARGLDTRIQVDGGVTPENTPALVAAGADILVSGSAFFGYPPYGERLRTFHDAAKKGRT